jgi:hypothetical protein
MYDITNLVSMESHHVELECECYTTLSCDRLLFSKVILHYFELLEKGTVSVAWHFHLQIY